MSSLRVLLICCAVGVWLNACGTPADPEVAVAQLIFATYGAGDGVTVAYLAPVPAEQPAFATRRIWRGAGGRLAELPLAANSTLAAPRIMSKPAPITATPSARGVRHRVRSTCNPTALAGNAPATAPARA